MGTAVGEPVPNANLVGILTHTLSGADADSFSVDSASGQLRTAELLDYEVRDSYAVSVEIQHDNGTDTIPVTISVLDVEEPGVLSVAPTTLRAGTVIRARLADPDGGMRPDQGIIWEWSVSTDGARFTNVKTGLPGHFTREASEIATFTPDSAHVGKYLRVSVRYSDRRSAGHAWSLDKSAVWTSATRITAATAALPELTVRPLVSGLSVPWDIAFTPEGTMLITERGGRIYSRSTDGQMQQVEADVSDIFITREVGLMGIAVDPSFSVASAQGDGDATFGRFYTCMAVNGDNGPEAQVIKWDMKNDYSEAVRLDEPLVSGIPLTQEGRHGGCRIRFGPDDYLWITTGDGAIAGSPQDLTSLAGKVLRVDAQTGAGAPDNPFTAPSDSRIYTYGHRNPQGLAFRPGTNQVWTVEHGPDRDDEINLLTSGGNYGWNPGPPYNEDVPMTDLQAFPEAIEAKWQSWYPAIAPSGAVFLDGEGWGAWNGRLAVALLKEKYLKVFEFDSSGTLLSEVLVPELDQHYGRLRSPVMGPDGALYITTSNGPGKDHILQVTTPQVSGPDAVSYTTGGTEPVATFTPHQLTTPVTWTLSGQDAGRFSISAAGVLSFASAPDFDNPQDADEDNVYRVLVEAQGASDGPKARRTVAVTVTPPMPIVSITAGSGITEGGDASFTVTASPAPAADLDVSVTVSQSGDYGAATGQQTVTIPTAGSATLTVGTTNDGADEADGSVTATLDAPATDAGYTVSAAQGAATVSVSDDDDPKPEVSITAFQDSITEGGRITLIFRASPAPAASLSVRFTVSESGDYGAAITGQQTATIPTAGVATLSFRTANDDADEADGSVTATLDTPAANAGYTVSATQGAATVNVLDNDEPGPEVSVTAGSGVTEGGDATFTITASPAPAADLDVSVTVSQSGEYGAATGQQTVTIPTAGSATLTVGTTNDGADEADGSVTATLDTPAANAGYTVSATQGAATVTVADDDVPEVRITALHDSITEGGRVTLIFKASPAPAGILYVNFTVSQSGDYGAVITGQQTANITSAGLATLTFRTANDDADEADGSVTATLDTPAANAGYTVSATQGAATVNVLDDDDPPEPEVSVTAGSGVTEGDRVTFTFRASPAPAGILYVNFTVSQSGDYGALTGQQSMTITSAGLATLTLITVNDDADEADGSVTATLDTPASDAGYTVSASQGAATVSVADDDDAPADVFTPDADVFTPDADMVTTIAAAAERLDKLLKGIKGESGGYTSAQCRQVAAALGASDDWDPWCDEIERRENWTPTGDNQPPPPPQPEVSVSAGSGVTEGGDASFTITASPAPAANLDVSVTVSQSGDYGAATGQQTVTIPTTGSFTLTVGTTDDGADEADGSVTATVNTGSDYTVSASQGAATVSVADDDNPPPPATPEVSVTAGSGVTEGGDASFTITASPAPAANLDVSVTVSQSGDYGAATGQRTVTILTTGSFTLTVGTTNDWADEADGSVTATVNTGNGYTVSASQGAATVSVADDDDPPPPATPEVSVTAGSGVTEGGNASFTITASPAPAANLDVSVTVSQSGDYGATTGQRTVTIPPAGSATLTVGTTNDGADEADGSVTATVNTGSGYTVSEAQGAATVSVADDDDPPPPATPEVSVTAGNGVTEGGNASFTITASPAPTANLDVSVTVSQSGNYGATTGQRTVTIPPAGSATLTVGTTNDGADEADGSVTATVNTGSGYTVSAAQGAATVSVADDDDPPPPATPEVSVTAGNGVTEGGNASFTITASPAPAANLDVSVTVSASGDYGATTGQRTVTIPTTGSFTLTVGTTNDGADEADGSVTATVNTGSDYTVSSSQGAATVSVADDDDAPEPEVELSVTVEDASATEGGVVEFRILLSHALTEEFEVTWYTGPAYHMPDWANSSDYQTMAGVMVFEPGVTELTGEVWLEQDDKKEPDEYFAVEAFLPGEWFTPAAVGTMTIVDDD